MSTDKAATIELTQILDLTAAKPLKDALQAVRGEAVLVNASQVDRLGAQCLQVLLSASKTWGAEGHEFEIKDSSDNFASGLETFGLNLDVFTEMEVAA